MLPLCKRPADFVGSIENLLRRARRACYNRRVTSSPDTLALFDRIAQTFNLSLDLDDVLNRVMDEVIAVTCAERGLIMLRGADGQLAMRAARGVDQHDGTSAHLQSVLSLVELVTRTNAPQLFADARQAPDFRDSSGMVDPPWRSVLCVPMQLKDRNIGVIYVDHPLQTGVFSEQDAELLTALGRHAAIAIENARLFRAMDQQLASLQLLHEISVDLTSTLDLDAVLIATLERVQHAFAAETASILIVEGDELVFKVALGAKADEVKPFRVPLGHGIAGWVAQNRRGTFTNDARHDERFYAAVDKGTGFVTNMLMAAPLALKDHVIGVVEVSNKPGGFTDADLDLLSTISASAAIAIENARLYQIAVEQGRIERELQMAREVQANFIPRDTPHIPGWEFSADWQSAFEVSGDFYDFIYGEQPQLGIAIGDVADKGMAAALFMTLTRTVVRTSVLHGRDAADAISAANRVICADAAAGMFVTLCYAQLHCGTGEVQLVNAGHPAPLVYRADCDQLSELTPHGLPLGISDTARFPDERLALNAGDFILFYTDGLTDALNAQGEEFGKSRLLSVIHEYRHEVSQSMVDALRQSLLEFIGAAAPVDDMTVVIARRTA
jgi:sigma-B regulation protein RsbU (phosphoserine phosphatase)